MPSSLHTIDDVLAELDHIVAHTVEQNTPLGVFAYVYRRTTAKIKEGLEKGLFSDKEKLERFDVAFAKRYIDAYWQHYNNEPPTLSWQASFEAAGRPITLLQHTMLGMNAHINLDLGIVAAEAAPGDHIHEIKADFMLVNQILEELIDEMQERLSRVSRLMILIDWAGGRTDESVVNFSIRRARDFAWLNARNLAYLEGQERAQYIQTVDEQIAALARHIAYPRGRFLRTCLRCVQFFEEKQVARVIQLLQ
ncbi:MAG: hypothetical protein H6566_14740 [Lewinellaceae bacterium]|nr:hypothetical protein [Lewinellaceae bacterium]